MQWLRSAITAFKALVQPLHDFLEVVYQKFGKSTKRTVAKAILAHSGWNESNVAALQRCKEAIIHRTTLLHHDESKRLSIYIDASHTHYSDIVTQVPYQERKMSHSEQHHKPLSLHRQFLYRGARLEYLGERSLRRARFH